jgi:hypothetical protein
MLVGARDFFLHAKGIFHGSAPCFVQSTSFFFDCRDCNNSYHHTFVYGTYIVDAQTLAKGAGSSNVQKQSQVKGVRVPRPKYPVMCHN